jgi:hypothetical protein
LVGRITVRFPTTAIVRKLKLLDVRIDSFDEGDITLINAFHGLSLKAINDKLKDAL